MIKLFLALILFIFLVFPTNVLAQSSSFVSIVNPIRGVDFWEDKNQQPQTVVSRQAQILKELGISATWLLRFDALTNPEVRGILKNLPAHEKGIFLEVTTSWAKDAGVSYHGSQNWHEAGSAFLSGYERDEREKLIDSVFEKFKQIFGYYPKSVGAWFIDAYAFSYMEQKYGITASLIVADQYTTDNYQVWGQYFGTPYYPSKKHTLRPAQSKDEKLPLVLMQWAARDPINGYGDQVEESTYSVQANDYLDYHKLDINYFSSLIDIYTKQKFNKFNHLVVGLENSYLWEKYGLEYRKQIEILVDKMKRGQLQIVTMEDFSKWYQNIFPDLSPPHLIVADDPLGTNKKVVWFMNPYYRAGWFFGRDGSIFKDIRQYVEGEEELCYQKRCDQVNFATSATRVLDEISFGHKLVLDEGEISDFEISKLKENFLITYKNEVERERLIEFLPRDISIDGKISSIDGLILEATKDQLQKRQQTNLQQGPFKWSALSVLTKTFLFLGFLILGCLIPGWLLISKMLSKEPPHLQKFALSITVGFSLVTLLFYMLSIVNLKLLIFIYLLLNFLILNKILQWKKFVRIANLNIIKDKFNLLILSLIIAGTVFQNIPTFKNGLHFPYGLGFWGPNTHDGIWHISLINQLTRSVPPQSPIFAGEILKNYHYFYDLLVAATNYVTQVPVQDLLFRFYPISFSLLLGAGSYFIIKSLTKQKLALFFSLYLVYFAGSFGWIVEYIKFKHLGGESAFWANQSISFNLNPPFAISLLLVSAIILLLPNLKSKLSIILISLLAGSLIAFKAYGAVLILISFILVGILKRNLHYIMVFVLGSIIAAFLFLSNFSLGKQLIIFSPFWFIHSMIDSPDRVGWVRLSLARTTGWKTGNWFKFITAETISFLIFLIGNLGTRIFTLLALLRLLYIVRRPQLLFIFVLSFLAFIIPTLFIQAGNPWNTIQFIYYFLYFAAILGGIIFAKIITSINKIAAIVLSLIFIAITPINSWATANGYLSYQPHALITNEEFEALNFLNSQKEGVVLTYPYDEKLKNKLVEPWPLYVYDSTAYVSALSGKAVYVEDEPQNQILLTDYKKRIVGTLEFFQSRDFNWSGGFLETNNIRYIYVPKMFNVSLDEDKLNLKNIFENDEVIIYEVF